MERFPSFSRRGEKILESSLENVTTRIEEHASREGYTVAFRDGAPDGVLQFYILKDDFKIADTQAHTVFLEQLKLIDAIVDKENSRIVEEGGYEAYIEVEPRKEMM